MPTERRQKADEAAFNKMRAQWRNRIALDRRLTHLSVRALLCIEAAHLNKKSREAFPGMDTIAGEIGASENSVRDAIKKAEGLGYLKVTRGGGYKRSNRYRLALPDTKPSPDLEGIEDKASTPDDLIEDDNFAPHAEDRHYKPSPDLRGSEGQYPSNREAIPPKSAADTPQIRQGEPVENQRKEPEGAAASSGAPPVATVAHTSEVSPASGVGEDHSLSDGQTGEAARADRAPPPHAAEENGKPKYPRDWAQGLSEAEASAELQSAGDHWRCLLDDCEDRQAIQRALWRYCEGIHRAKALGKELPRVPPPSEWMRDRWFAHPEWWGLPADAPQKSSKLIHGG